jgi:hypothetical protein
LIVVTCDIDTTVPIALGRDILESVVVSFGKKIEGAIARDDDILDDSTVKIVLSSNSNVAARYDAILNCGTSTTNAEACRRVGTATPKYVLVEVQGGWPHHVQGVVRPAHAVEINVEN